MIRSISIRWTVNTACTGGIRIGYITLVQTPEREIQVVGVNGRIILKLIKIRTIRGCGFLAGVSGYGQLVSFCVHGDDSLD
jgi:hypothetical protein